MQRAWGSCSLSEAALQKLGAGTRSRAERIQLRCLLYARSGHEVFQQRKTGTPGGAFHFLLCLEINVKFFAGSAEVSNLFRLVEILRNLFQRLVEFGIGQAERAQIGRIALQPARRRWSTCQCSPAQDRGHEKNRQQNCSHAKSTFLELDARGVLCLRVVEGLNTSRCRVTN